MALQATRLPTQRHRPSFGKSWASSLRFADGHAPQPHHQRSLWSSAEQRDWRSNQRCCRRECRNLTKVTTSTSRLNPQRGTKIHHPPAKVEGPVSSSEHTEDRSEQREEPDYGYSGMDEYNWSLCNLATKMDGGQIKAGECRYDQNHQ